jgi:hypothetical protein
VCDETSCPPSRDGHLDWVPRGPLLLPGPSDTRGAPFWGALKARSSVGVCRQGGRLCVLSLPVWAFCVAAFGGCRLVARAVGELVCCRGREGKGFSPCCRALSPCSLALRLCLPIDLALVPAGCCRHGAHLHQALPEALLQAGDAYPHGRSRRSW